MFGKIVIALTACLALSACNKTEDAKAPLQGMQIAGAGATFPAPLYAKWAEAQKGETGLALNYQAIGSGGGIKQIKAKTVAFGASDKPLKPDELEEAGLVQFPTVIGGVVPVVNIPGIVGGQIKLTGPQLADIYLGNIRKWKDPALVAANPGVTLPNLPIMPPLTADAIDFITNPAVADNTAVVRVLSPKLTPLRQGLKTYLAPAEATPAV